MSQTQAIPPSTQPSSRRKNRALGVLTLIFRLLLLGVSGGLAWLIGIAIAQLAPGTVAEPPLTERLLQQVEDLNARRQTGVMPFQPSTQPAAEPSLAPTPLTLAPSARQTAQAEVNQIQGNLQTLSDRATALETELGIVPTAAPLDARLRRLQQSIDPTAAPVETSPVAAGERTLLVTLPSDALFEPNGQMLRPAARGILDSIAQDLQAYPNAVMRVAAHSDASGSAEAQREQSFAQASTVTGYLQSRLGAGYTWLTVGYGNTKPLTGAGNSPDPSRNRRIEIRIVPR
ncbi:MULTISPECIES: OmpA family protein [unclassified Leptolyngbya]|uniref:OmpA family protein n=1 Tax=unclassified Leptolyngbya TaxID=2650499 RepID=UPI0016839372|nr:MULTISPECIES: OmpA family protein [unclassified Leptolyngbya]MBD1910854.1 OmpA family protein [Leptolyngbya sp. FACHB-8]MBD2153751.1 OmpA family protein [Leptolyngbya sp. FACHB-16]